LPKITENQLSKIGVYSEIGKLKKVFLHTPGKEVELMTPENANELLYNDIIYYKNIVEAHQQLKSVLSLTSQVLEVSKCLADVLDIYEAREKLIDQVLLYQKCPELKPDLMQISSKELAEILITGFPLKRKTLESWLSSKTFSLIPLPNMYFMRDTSMVIGNRVVLSRMASSVRFTESIIMRTIYEFHPELKGCGILFDACQNQSDSRLTIEGGDVLIVNKNLFLIGISERTTPKAIDLLIDALIRTRHEDGILEAFHVLCVTLPPERSTIHLDMIFTLVSHEQAVIYSPFVTGKKKSPVISIEVKSNGEKKFKDTDDLLTALKNVGVKIDPILCGGENPLHQQREQWNSGANFFSFAPGKAISYIHEHTLKSCEAAGFQIVSATDVIKHPTLLQSQSPTIVTVEGSELSRGGGGPRCMTCPVLRDSVI
jgi:arginine deiminase